MVQIIEEQQEKYKLRNQKLILNNCTKSIKVSVDEWLMRMVVENIIDNASKYSPDRGIVSVDLYINVGDAIINIKDNGFGISKADQKKLFQKFSRIENKNTLHIGGTGLCLYWAKKIVDMHDGKISLKSSSDAGTTFSVSLPQK